MFLTIASPSHPKREGTAEIPKPSDFTLLPRHSLPPSRQTSLLSHTIHSPQAAPTRHPPACMSQAPKPREVK